MPKRRHSIYPREENFIAPYPLAFCKRPTTFRRSRRDNGLRLIRRSKMDLQEETAMPMGASKSSHHQRMAYQVFRKARLLHYPQI